jgi:hypothetical protein
MTLHAPQIIMIVLITLGVIQGIVFNGKTSVSKYSWWNGVLNALVITALLWWGGFWG